MANPLDKFVSSPASTNDIKLPALPSAKTLVQEKGLMEGLTHFDQQFEEWRQNVERLINERIRSL